jgi:hypothetical protein
MAATRVPFRRVNLCWHRPETPRLVNAVELSSFGMKRVDARKTYRASKLVRTDDTRGPVPNDPRSTFPRLRLGLGHAEGSRVRRL